MKDAARPETNPNTPSWHEETAVLHGDAWLSSDASVVPPIHYSATFKANSTEEFAEMANTPRHPGFYTRYGNPVHKRSEEHTSELQSLMRTSYAAFGLNKKHEH